MFGIVDILLDGWMAATALVAAGEEFAGGVVGEAPMGCTD
jgi:hypothetical protein